MTRLSRDCHCGTRRDRRPWKENLTLATLATLVTLVQDCIDPKFVPSPALDFAILLCTFPSLEWPPYKYHLSSLDSSSLLPPPLSSLFNLFPEPPPSKAHTHGSTHCMHHPRPLRVHPARRRNPVDLTNPIPKTSFIHPPSLRHRYLSPTTNSSSLWENLS